MLYFKDKCALFLYEKSVIYFVAYLYCHTLVIYLLYKQHFYMLMTRFKAAPYRSQ